MNQPPDAASQAATAAGTAGYRDRLRGVAAEDHFRQSQGLWMSSIGLGSYLGDPDERTDEAYRAAVKRAAALGCNVFDTAANYRFQRSERNFGDALGEMFSGGSLAREEVIVTTKGGFLPFDTEPPRSRQDFARYLEETFIRPGVCRLEDFVQGSHCMTPRYLEHQLNQSLRNLKLSAVDVYYIHNPESQLAEVDREEFYTRLRAAFEFLESAVGAGKLTMYGTATWNGYRVPAGSAEHLSLERVVNTAREVAGDNHHFKVVQLPFNLAMIEALNNASQVVGGNRLTFLEAAGELGVTVMSSASILQSKLASGLPPVVGEAFRGLRTDAQRALQFTRSTPGITTALVGMSSTAHVEENLELAKTAPASIEEFMKLFDQA
ncbi:MAG TPA: aldo/keto reductase [Blastocatellia bacterium]|nr:aldo/keto reductase [Blastocatellia bacterium]